MSACDWEKKNIGLMHQNPVKHGMEEWFSYSKGCIQWSKETDPPQDILIPYNSLKLQYRTEQNKWRAMLVEERGAREYFRLIDAIVSYWYLVCWWWKVVKCQTLPLLSLPNIKLYLTSVNNIQHKMILHYYYCYFLVVVLSLVWHFHMGHQTLQCLRHLLCIKREREREFRI